MDPEVETTPDALSHFFVPIARVDDDQREVHGYAFQNETVDGEGGIALLRSAMEDATADYLKWGALRSMHQPIAAGTVPAVTWDDAGAFIRARVVDDQEWRKVKEGVYKGFSVGVRPRMVRNKRVEQCSWIETSLVDRPKDPGATITLFRVDGREEEALEEAPAEPEAEERVEAASVEEPAADPEAAPEERVDAAPAFNLPLSETQQEIITAAGTELPEGHIVLTPTMRALNDAYTVIRSHLAGSEVPAGTDEEAWCSHMVRSLREDLERAITTDTPGLPVRENLEGAMPGRTHYDCGSKDGCHGHTTRGGAHECMTHRTEEPEEVRVDEPAPEEISDLTAEEPEAPDLARMVELETANADLLTRLEGLESDLAEERAARAAARERVAELEAMPAAVRPVVRYPTCLERTFLINEGGGFTARRRDLETELGKLEALPPTADAGEGRDRITRMQLIRMELASLNAG